MDYKRNLTSLKQKIKVSFIAVVVTENKLEKVNPNRSETKG